MSMNQTSSNKAACAAPTTNNFTGPSVAAAVLMVLLLAAAVFASFTGAQKKVVLLVEGERIESRSFAGSVDELLREHGVELGVKDRVSPLPDTSLQDGMTVVVRRAVPVTLQVGNNESKLTTAAETVGDLLEERNIVVGERDILSPGRNANLKSGMHVRVDRITVSNVEEEVPIEFKVQRESDGNLSRGITKVVRQGVKGLERRTWAVTFKNGEEIERQLVDNTVIKEPVDQIVSVGTMMVASRGGQDIRFSRAFEMVSTAYTHTGNNTSTGVKPQVGIVAVDPSVIPLGTRLYVDGYGYCRAMDTGGKIKGNRIDVFLDTREEAKRWGVKKVKVYILE